ncbi:MAG: ATP-binding cassette domain-containing protein [Sulfuricurvum sp.]
MADLCVENVTVRHVGKTAIEAISFEASKGEIIGLIGADGAGKSSLLHAVAGVIAFEGSVRFEGYAYGSPKEAEAIKERIGLMPQGIGLVLYDQLTVDEHLRFFADIRNIPYDEKFVAYKERLLRMAGLERFMTRRAGNLSGGMMQKLSLICTLIHRPKLLILDEPTTGVDPLSRIELWEILDQIRKEEGTIILVSTAYMQEAALMDRLLLIDEGDIIASGDAASLIDSIGPMCYERSDIALPNAIRTLDTTYSLEPLELPRVKPTLEALFFVNAIRKGFFPPPLEISRAERSDEFPDILMQAQGLTKRFGDFIANDSVDIRLCKGEILGLLGANGAGKTTFIKMLLGLLPMDGGNLELLGQPIRSVRDRQMLKSSIGYVSQHFALYDDMTVRENLLYFATIRQIPLDVALGRIARYAEELGFKPYLDKLPKELPLGINQRFSLAAALLHEPVVLFLDEPTSGVDAIARSQFWQLLSALKEKWRISILITTHYMSEAEFCDRVVLMKEGRKVADDSIDNLYLSHPKAHSFEDIFLEYYR